MITDQLGVLLAEAAGRGVAPRLDAGIWIDGDLHELSSSREAPAPFDLASLTKPLASGLVALSLAAEGLLDLDAATAEGPSARQLLDHSAGYEEWHPFFKACFEDETAQEIFQPNVAGALAAGAFARSRQIVAQLVSAARPAGPPGKRTTYSDVGFLKLQQLLEAAGGKTLSELFVSRVAQPLGVNLGFVDLTRGDQANLPAALPTGRLRPRPPAQGQEQDLAGLPMSDVGASRGRVDDDNAFALGGVAGHAGLFGTAGAVALAGARFLEECDGRGRIGPSDLARAFCGPSVRGGQGGRGLGWDRPSGRSSLGTLLGQGSLGAVGHLGYTGCSLWVDRDRRVSIALCSNRVLHGRDNLMIRDFRPSFHDAVARTFDLA